MRRISAVFGGGGKHKDEPSPPHGDKPGLAPIPPPSDTWRVDEAFLESSCRLVPASPDDVDDHTRNVFFLKTFNPKNDWVDFDAAMYGLGLALDIFPENSTFLSVKWIFVRLLYNLIKIKSPECLNTKVFIV